MSPSHRYMTVSDTGEETWYDSYDEAIAAAGDTLCVVEHTYKSFVEHTYERIRQEFVHHAEGHESEDCGR